MKTLVVPGPAALQVRLLLTGTIAAGLFIDLGNNVGCHQNGGVSGDIDTVHMGGVYRVTKVAGAAWVPGVTPIYLDDAAQNFTHTAAAHKKAGFPAEAATSAATAGLVMLVPDKT